VAIWVKDPDDTAWYELDWSEFLSAGETITSATVSVGAGLTLLAQTAALTSVSFQVSGGVAPSVVFVTCQVTTSQGNVFETTKSITVATRETW